MRNRITSTCTPKFETTYVLVHVRTALERLDVFDNVGMLEFIANDRQLVHDFTDALLTLAHLSPERNILVPSFM